MGHGAFWGTTKNFTSQKNLNFSEFSAKCRDGIFFRKNLDQMESDKTAIWNWPLHFSRNIFCSDNQHIFFSFLRFFCEKCRQKNAEKSGFACSKMCTSAEKFKWSGGTFFVSDCSSRVRMWTLEKSSRKVFNFGDYYWNHVKERSF